MPPVRPRSGPTMGSESNCPPADSGPCIGRDEDAPGEVVADAAYVYLRKHVAHDDIIDAMVAAVAGVVG